MNWGKGIAIALGLFITFIVVLVVGFFSHSVDLEAENYYEREIAYEDEIQALRNANKIESQIKLSAKEDFILLEIPKGDFSDVKLDMLRPDNKNLDKSYTVQGTKSFLVPKKELQNGKYKISISYKNNGKDCLQKDVIYIQ